MTAEEYKQWENDMKTTQAHNKLYINEYKK